MNLTPSLRLAWGLLLPTTPQRYFLNTFYVSEGIAYDLAHALNNFFIDWTRNIKRKIYFSVMNDITIYKIALALKKEVRLFAATFIAF